MAKLKGFWSSWEYVKEPKTGEKLVKIYLSPFAKDEPFIMDESVYYGYIWKDKPVLRKTKTWFHFAPSTPFLSRLIHDPSSGRHISQSFFHDDGYGDLDRKPISSIKVDALLDACRSKMSDKFLAAISEFESLTVDPVISREEADDLWLEVGKYFKADELDEELTYEGLRAGGGVFHWLKNSKLGKMVGL